MSNTRYLMMASATMLVLAGLGVSFAPAEFLEALGIAAREPLPAMLKVMGGLYLGFALMNWTAKDNMIGGIYSRPVAIGNFIHFMVGSLSLAKQQVSGEFSAVLVGILVVYGVFAGLFGWLVFGQGAACATAGSES